MGIAVSSEATDVMVLDDDDIISSAEDSCRSVWMMRQ